MSTTKLEYTPVDDIPKIHNELLATFKSRKLNSLPYRKYLLLQLGYLIRDNADRIKDAVQADLGRPGFESQFLEIGGSIAEVKEAYYNLDKWAKPEKQAFSINYGFAKPTVYKEGKGVVLIISPFNYPVWLIFSPLVGAIAAGNTVVVKPSELTPVTSALYAEIFPKYIDPSIIRIINGAVPETTKLLELPWGHILYTGSGRVGRIVAGAAAKTLTPVSLELGGKTPVFIDPKCDLKTAARRVLWGRAVNAGQTCVAPDYVLVPRAFQEEFVKELKAAYEEFYPHPTRTSAPDTFSRLVTPQALVRVDRLLRATKGQIVFGGEKSEEDDRFLGLTVVRDVPGEDSLMEEEIFGPVLPIVPVEDVNEAVEYVNAHDHPLAIYVFSKDEEYKKKILENTQSGGISFNEVIFHLAVPGLPFGGTGPSGSGYHTGKYSFDMFTHLRSSMDQPTWLDRILKARYPPYDAKKLKTISNFLPDSLPPRPTGPPPSSAVAKSDGLKKWWIVAFVIAVVAGGLTKVRRGSK